MADVQIPDIKKLSPEEIQRALTLLSNEKRYKERIKSGEIKGTPKVSEMTKEQYAAYQKSSRKTTLKVSMRVAKFLAMVKAGTAKDITDAEVEAEYNKRYAAKK